MFKIKGVVTDVNKSALDKLAKTDGRIANARVHGEWMTPAITLKRAESDNQAGSSQAPSGDVE